MNLKNFIKPFIDTIHVDLKYKDKDGTYTQIALPLVLYEKHYEKGLYNELLERKVKYLQVKKNNDILIYLE